MINLGTTSAEVLGTLALLSIPVGILGLLVVGIIGGIRSRNIQISWILLPLLIDFAYLLAAHFLSGPVVNDYHDHAYEGPIAAFGLLGLPALAIFVFRARANIWPALSLAAVGLLVWYLVWFHGLNMMTDGRAVI